MGLDFGCPFRSAAGCKSCDYVIYRKCSTFRQHHLRRCASELVPFKFTTIKRRDGSVFMPSAPVVWSFCEVPNVVSVDMLYRNSTYVWLSDRLKSLAVRAAIERNTAFPVQYFNLERVISSCFAYNRGEFDFQDSIYFLEIYSRGSRDSKAISMVDSFINLALSMHGRVFLLSSWCPPTIGSDWFELPAPRMVRSAATSSVGSASSPSVPSPSVGPSSGLLSSPETRQFRDHDEIV